METIENKVADKRCMGASPVSVDTIPGTPQVMETTAAPAATKQDNVGAEVPDNLGNGATFGDPYDGFSDINNESDKIQAQFTD